MLQLRIFRRQNYFLADEKNLKNLKEIFNCLNEKMEEKC